MAVTINNCLDGHQRLPLLWAVRCGGMNESHLVCDSEEWRAFVRDTIIPWAVDDVDLGDNALEIGPGYGATTEVFAERLPHLTSVEIDLGLATRLAERFAGSNVDVVVGDATSLDFDDETFTSALCFSMLHHVPSPELQNQLFAEAARVLRPGAPFVAVDSVWSREVEAFHDGDTYIPADPASLPDRLDAAGFADIDVRVGPFGWTALAKKRA